MKTIAQRWAQFEPALLPANAGAHQREEMRCAFYTGALSVLASIEAGIRECGSDVERGTRMLQVLHGECAQFAEEIKDDSA